ncbi:unnamed protein product [Moneuplotes crassus]|uniref:Uncharacterized protein n=1 Tax=Euplotes crassus TaxID=5936 RepID=A0AAD1U6B6_EUPCR|nr:unnamed protein product [Moneuplotes crassus]
MSKRVLRTAKKVINCCNLSEKGIKNALNNAFKSVVKNRQSEKTLESTINLIEDFIEEFTKSSMNLMGKYLNEESKRKIATGPIISRLANASKLNYKFPLDLLSSKPESKESEIEKEHTILKSSESQNSVEFLHLVQTKKNKLSPSKNSGSSEVEQEEEAKIQKKPSACKDQLSVAQDRSIEECTKPQESEILSEKEDKLKQIESNDKSDVIEINSQTKKDPNLEHKVGVSQKMSKEGPEPDNLHSFPELPSHSCQICTDSFSNTYTFTQHLIQHHFPLTLKCPVPKCT